MITIQKGTRVGYPDKTILTFTEGITLPDDGLVLLVGKNGAGKSTLMKYLTGCLQVSIRPALRSAYLPEELQFPKYVSTKAIAAAWLKSATRPYFETLIEAFDLDFKKGFGTLSKGNRQKLRVAMTMALAREKNVELMLLDEPMSGLDFVTRKSVWTAIIQQSKERLVVTSLHAENPPIEPRLVLAVTESTVIQPPRSEWEWARLEQILEPEYV